MNYSSNQTPFPQQQTLQLPQPDPWLQSCLLALQQQHPHSQSLLQHPQNDDSHVDPRSVILLKVKRKSPGQTNPTHIALQRIVHQMELYPEDISESEYQHIRRQEQLDQLHRSNQLNLPNTTNNTNNAASASHIKPQDRPENKLVSLLGGLDLSQPVLSSNHSQPPFSISQSGYIPPPSISQHDPAAHAKFNLSSPSQQHFQPHQTVLQSNTIFKRIGAASQNDISTLKLASWYRQQTTPNSKTNIAVFEVSTLNSAEELLNQHQQTAAKSQIENGPQDQQNPKPHSALHTLQQMYGDSLKKLLEVLPVQDQNYQSSSSQPQSKIAGLKPPPPRRGKPAATSANKQEPKNSSQLNKNELSIPNAISTHALLDSDTLQYLQHRKYMSQLQQTEQQENISHESGMESTVHENDTMNDDMYDIYEVHIPSPQQSTPNSNSNGQDESQFDVNNIPVVIPRSELDYVLNVQHIDSLLSYQSVHEEFVAQFSKPRLQFHQRLIHRSKELDLGRAGRKQRQHIDDDGDHQSHLESLEYGYDDDDYHPDFDSDVDYPDSDNGSDCAGNGRNGGDEEYGDDDDQPFNLEEYDDDDDDYYYMYLNGDNDNGSEHSDDDDDDNENENLGFRYGGIAQTNRPGLFDELDEQDPTMREFILRHHQNYKHTVNRGLKSLDQSLKLPGQDDGDVEETNAMGETNNNNNAPNSSIPVYDQQNRPSSSHNDMMDDVDKVNRVAFNLLFQSDGDEDDNNSGSDDNPNCRSCKSSQYYYDDNEDPYAGTNTFRQFAHKKKVNDHGDNE